MIKLPDLRYLQLSCIKKAVPLQQISQNMRKITIISALLLGVCISSSAQHNHEHDHDHDHDHHHHHDTTEVVHKEKELQGIVVRSKNPIRRMVGAVNGVSIHKEELFKAACCNLGESFTTNPAVDVSYTDAATGPPGYWTARWRPQRRRRRRGDTWKAGAPSSWRCWDWPRYRPWRR